MLLPQNNYRVDTDCCVQNLVKNFKELGFKVQSQPLSHFHNDYGLEGGEDEEEEDEDDTDDEDVDGSDSDASMSDVN